MHDRNEAGKVFVGGLSWDTTKDSLLAYFSQYGEVIDCVVMKNQQTGKSRGFGFVTYRDVNCVETVLSVPSHIIDGRQVDPKACNPKGLLQRQGGEQGGPPPRQNNRGPRGGQDAFKDKKIFIGGLPNSVDEDFLKNFFSKYGRVIDLSIMYDQQQQRSRGFGFLTLETDEAVDQLCRERYVNIGGKKVECKRAEPRSKENQDKDIQIQLPGLPIQHLEMAGGPPPQQQQPNQPPEGTWPPPDGNWAPGQVPASVAAPPNYQNMPFQGGYQEQPAGLQPTSWPPQQQPPPQGAGAWPPAGPPPGQQPPPGSAPFPGQPPSTQAYSSPQGQPPNAAPGYQWSSPPGQAPPPSGQPPQAVPVGQNPPGAYGAYVPVSASPQQAPAGAPPGRPYGEFPANGQSHVSPAPGAQLPVSSPQNFPGYASPYGAPVSQAGSGTPTDPYGQSAVVPAPGGAIQIPGVPAPGQPQPVPGYGSPVTPAGAVGSITDPAAGSVKPAEYANYYGTYGYAGDATAAAYGATPAAQNPYGNPAEAPQQVAYGGAPGPSPTFQRQGSGTQAYHPYRR